MDAYRFRIAVLSVWLLFSSAIQAATHATANFVVTAPTEDQAKQVGQAAEFWRHELAVIWLGKGLPNWSRPCTVSVKVGQIGAGGSTTFTFENGEVFGWNMKVQGTLERILDSVIPHEVNHTIFASHFRRPLPRWADEGAATIVEHESERLRQTALLNQVIHTRRRIPLEQLLAIKEYPEDMQQVLTLYAEGYSLSDYLIQRKGDAGRKVFLQFLTDAHEEGWNSAIKKHYGYHEVAKLESDWTGWIVAGSPSLNIPSGSLLADGRERTSSELAAAPVARSQSPDASTSPIAANQPEMAGAEEKKLPPDPLPPIPRRLRDPDTASQLNAPHPVMTAGLGHSDLTGGGSWIESEPVTNSRSRREDGYRSESSLLDAIHSPANGHVRSRIREVDLDEMYGFPASRSH